MIRPFEQRKREKKEFKELASWTIITALDSILEQAEDSQLSDAFWETVKNPLAYLRQQLGLTNIQIVVLAMIIEAGDTVTWRQLGQNLGCSRLSMTHPKTAGSHWSRS